jgi:hypothetical protein
VRRACEELGIALDAAPGVKYQQEARRVSQMFPIQADLLFWIKGFIFFTCLFFWIRFIYDKVQKSNRMRPGRWDDDDEP